MRRAADSMNREPAIQWAAIDAALFRNDGLEAVAIVLTAGNHSALEVIDVLVLRYQKLRQDLPHCFLYPDEDFAGFGP